MTEYEEYMERNTIFHFEEYLNEDEDNSMLEFKGTRFVQDVNPFIKGSTYTSLLFDYKTCIVHGIQNINGNRQVTVGDFNGYSLSICHEEKTFQLYRFPLSLAE